MTNAMAWPEARPEPGWHELEEFEESVEVAAEPPAATPPPQQPTWGYVDGTESVRGADSARESALVSPLFEVLLDRWLGRANHSSNIRRSTKSPEYKLLLLGGDRHVALVLHRLREEANPLLIWLLGDLTGEDPARGVHTIEEAAELWLSWGANHLAP